MTIQQMLKERHLPPLEYLAKNVPSWFAPNFLKYAYTNVHDDRLPDNTDTYHEGGVAYHRRYGKHVLSRCDWNKYMDYILRHLDD